MQQILLVTCIIVDNICRILVGGVIGRCMHTTDPYEHPIVEQQSIIKVMKSDLSGTDQTGNFRGMTATTINGQPITLPLVYVWGVKITN